MKSFTSPYRCRCGSHVGTPAASVSESMSRYQPRRSRKPAGPDIAGGWHGVGDLDSHPAGWAHQPSGPRVVGSTVEHADVRRGGVARVERVGDGMDERRYLLEQGARLLEERRAPRMAWAATCTSECVPRQAGLVARRIVQPPWREDFGLVQRPQLAAAAIEFHGVKQPVHRAPRCLIGALHGREVGMRANVVRRQKQVRNGGGRLGTQCPGVDEVHQQRLGIPQPALGVRDRSQCPGRETTNAGPRRAALRHRRH